MFDLVEKGLNRPPLVYISLIQGLFVLSGVLLKE